jgi:WD40 repeat protein
MLRRILGPALAGTVALSLAACDYTTRTASSVKLSGSDTVAPTLADIGEPLYPDQPVPPKPPQVGDSSANDPVVVRQCQVVLPQTQNVPSKNDGRILQFCTEILPGEAKPPKDQIFEHPSGKDPNVKVQYRILHEGDTIRPGQLIAILDNALARANYLSAKAAVIANEAKKVAAIEVYNAALAEYEMYVRLHKTNSAPESDVRRNYAQKERAKADIADAEGQLLKSKEDLNKAEIVLEEHEVHCTIGGDIKRFYRKPGESIKALDPVAEVQDRGRYRIEGMMDVQYLSLFNRPALRNNHPVVIEAAPQTNYARELIGHLQPVRAVAVSKDPRKPLIVSASEDKTVRVWDRLSKVQKGTLPHPVPVFAVACPPAGAPENLCVTGADDGIVRLWDLDNPTADKPLRELGSASEKHQGRVVCAAFAPDGKTCTTADEREILLWDVATGKLRYRFAVQHKAPITSIQYTPQSRLVSEARDRSVCVWKLGEKGAAPEKVIENRTGDVSVLGVSPDGQSILFDQERALHLLTLNNQLTEGFLPAPSEASQFSGFALFSPDGRLVLAAGTGDNPLQLWKAPAAGGRGSLIRRLAAGAAPSCAAFAPDGSFAVTGTRDNRVLIWEMPTKAELDRQLTGTLTYLEPSINAAERKARVWAETNDPNTHLLEGDTVTLIIPRPEGR